MSAAILESVLTCPSCGHAQQEIMPTDACQYFYECTQCKTLLKPKAGDCCVFCSYGTVACPPIQCGCVRIEDCALSPGDVPPLKDASTGDCAC